MKNNEKLLEENLLKMTKLKEEKDKQLLNLEIFIGALVTTIFLVCTFAASFVNLEEKYRVLLIISGVIPFIVGLYVLFKDRTNSRIL